MCTCQARTCGPCRRGPRSPGPGPQLRAALHTQPRRAGLLETQRSAVLTVPGRIDSVWAERATESLSLLISVAASGEPGVAAPSPGPAQDGGEGAEGGGLGGRGCSSHATSLWGRAPRLLSPGSSPSAEWGALGHSRFPEMLIPLSRHTRNTGHELARGGAQRAVPPPPRNSPPWPQTTSSGCCACSGESKACRLRTDVSAGRAGCWIYKTQSYGDGGGRPHTCHGCT